MELLTQDDFFELPEDSTLAWLKLEGIARARLTDRMGDPSLTNEQRLIRFYISSIHALASQYGVKVGAEPRSTNAVEDLEKFQLEVNRAQMQAWASKATTYPSGQVRLSETARGRILDYSNQISKEIDELECSVRERKRLHGKLEDFRREVSNPTVGLGKALATLAQVSVIAASATTTASQAPDAYTNILMLLGAAQIEAEEDLKALAAPVDQKLLAPPPPQLPGPS